MHDKGDRMDIGCLALAILLLIWVLPGIIVLSRLMNFRHYRRISSDVEFVFFLGWFVGMGWMLVLATNDH